MSAHNSPALSQPGWSAATAVQFAILSAYGVILWLLAALAIRYGTPAGVFGPVPNVPVYAVTAVGCWWLVERAARTGRIAPGQVLESIAVICLAALLCDGVAIAWWPTLYGADASHLLPGIAWLSWAVAVCLLFAVRADRRGAVV